MENDYTVYIHKFPNDMVYVGLTKQDPERRWGTNGLGYKDQPVYSAIQYFGWDNIEHLIYKQNISADEAQWTEKELIEKYDSIENGYNSASGGGLGGNSWCEYEYNGIIYTAEELAEMSKYDLTGHDITNRLNEHKWSIEKTLNTPKQERNILFEYNGKKYTTKELYLLRKNINLSYSMIRDRIRHRGWDIERALTQPSNVKIQPKGVGTCEFEYNGQIYNSWELCQISPVEGLTSVDITTRINKHGWSVEKAITQPKKKRSIYEYNGQLYTSKELAALSPYNLSHHTITDRINRQGWDVEKAIMTKLNS